MKALRQSLILAAGLICSDLRADSTSVANSDSPDHLFQLQVIAPPMLGDSSKIALVASHTGKVLGSVILGGYAWYPQDAEPMNLSMLWSPTSSHLALMVRNTKRTWETRLYAASRKGLLAIELPSATKSALNLLGEKEIFRCCREQPAKWIAEDSLVVRASGDTRLKGNVIWYEVDVTYSVTKRSISNTKLISTEPHEG